MRLNPKSLRPARWPAQKAPRESAVATPSPTDPGPSDSEIVLLAVIGMSPAVLTETVWVLAKPSDPGESVIPDDVVVITTVTGHRAITDQLLTPSAEFGQETVWQSLRRSLLGPQATADHRLTLRVQVMESPEAITGLVQPLDDIRSHQENLAAAEFILREVRRYTDSNRRHLIASLAGGRKTMSALLHAAFSHLARPTDRLTHILVSEPFENSSLKPRFFYPGQPAQLLTAPDGSTCRAADAGLELADVPFAPMRLRFPDIADVPTRFRDLIQSYLDTFRRDATAPAAIELRSNPPRILVDGLPIELESDRQLLVIEFLLHANRKDWLRKDQVEAAEILKAWNGYPPKLPSVRSALRPAIQALYEKRQSRPGPDWIANAISDDIKRPLSYLRRKLQQAGAAWIPAQRNLELPKFYLAGTD